MLLVQEWLLDFRASHQAAKRGELQGESLVTYIHGRDELARALLAAQNIVLQPGQRPRRTLRVARALHVDLGCHDGRVSAMTLDISAMGFSVLLPRGPEVGDEVRVSIRMPGDEPLHAEARVVDVKPLVGNVRVSFQFIELEPTDSEQLERYVFDVLLAQLQ